MLLGIPPDMVRVVLSDRRASFAFLCRQTLGKLLVERAETTVLKGQAPRRYRHRRASLAFVPPVLPLRRVLYFDISIDQLLSQRICLRPVTRSSRLFSQLQKRSQLRRKLRGF